MTTEKKGISQDSLQALEALAAGVSAYGGCAQWIDELEPRTRGLLITALQRRTTAEVYRFITSWDGPEFPYSISTLRAYVSANRASWESANKPTYRGGER